MNVEFGWLEGRLLYLQAIFRSSFVISIWLSMRWRRSSWSCPATGTWHLLVLEHLLKGGSRGQAEVSSAGILS